MKRFASEGAVRLPIAVPLNCKYGALLNTNVLFFRIWCRKMRIMLAMFGLLCSLCTKVAQISMASAWGIDG